MIRHFILLLFPLPIFAFSDIGVVTIYFSYGKEHHIKVYHSVNDSIPFIICDSDEKMDSLLPSYYMYSGTSTISYCCASQTKDRYCIRKETLPSPFLWIEKDSTVEFSDWKSWWRGWGQTTVSPEEIIYSKPDDHSTTIKKECDCDNVLVDSLSGEWMKIIFSGNDCGNETMKCPMEKISSPLWIRWRKGDDILEYPYIAE